MSQGISNKPQALRRRNPLGMTQWIPNQVMDFDRFFDSMFDGDGGYLPDPFSTRMDVTETDQAVIVKMDLPGMSAQDIDISVENNMLTIRGERREEKEDNDKTKRIHRIERRFGSFSRNMLLPSTVTDSEAVAEFNQGVLVISLPKTEAAKPRRIAVK
jgi:HSP20 family protein